MTFKKRYIIILVVLIFIAFGIFTFAAPAGDESGKSGETVETPNDKTKPNDTASIDTDNNVVTLNSQTDENNNPNGNIEGNAGGIAASDDEAPNEGEDDIDAGDTDIDAIVAALVENLKKQTNDADSKEALELAKEYRKNNEIVDKVAALNNDLELTLQEILDELSKVLDDSNGPEFNIEDGALLNSIASINVEDNEGNDIISLILIDEEGNEVEFTNDLKLTDGEYTLVATDAAYNESDVTFTFDTTAPSMKVGDVVYTPDHTETIYSNTRFRAEAIDELSGIEKIYTNGKERTKIDVNGEGTYTFKLVDKAGNVTKYKVVVDKTAPSMKVGDVVYTPDHEETIYSKTRFTAEAIDKLSGIDKIYTNGKERTKIDVNGEGTYTFKLVDKAGNVAKYKVVVDKTAPSMKVGDVVYTPDHEGIIYSNTGFKAEAIDELSGVEKIYTNGKERTKIDVNGEGTYTFRLVDKVGNVAEYKVMVDKTAPSMKVGDVVYTPDHTEIIYSKTRFTAEAIDKLSGIDKIYTNGKERTKIDVNGEGAYTFKLVDKAGNVAEYKVIVDKSSPLLTLNGDSEITLEGGIDEYVEKYATATDAIDGVTKNIAPVEIKWYKYDENAGGDHYVYQGIVDEVNTKVPGRYNVIYWTSDAAGNMSKKVTRMVFVQDTTAPTVNVNLDANGNKDIYVEAGEKYIEPGATVTDNVDETYVTGPSEIKYYDLAENYDKEYTETLGTTVTTNKIGKYLLIYEVEDKAGNISDRNLLQAKRWVIVKDTIAPDVKVDVRTDKGVTDIVANDVTELSFEIYRDGALVHSFDSNATSKRFSIDWLGDGTYTVVAIDRGGNKASVEATINHTISSSEEFSKALETGGKFVLDENITLSGEESLSIASDKTVVLNLNNHTITNPVEAGAALENAGKLTITGNGAIVNGKSVRGSHTIVNLESGTLVIEGGNIGTEDTAGAAVVNYGTTTINGGTYASKQEDIKADGICAYAFINQSGTMTINNAKLEGQTHGLFGAYGGNIVVNGGNYTLDGNGGLGCYVVYSNGVGIVTLNGGTINTNSPRNNHVFYAYVGGNLYDKTVVDAGYVVIKDAIIYKDGNIQTF